jgi:Ni,Fe-hydrogenase III large subunit/Ni,Fe-hydrogenase III component G
MTAHQRLEQIRTHAGPAVVRGEIPADRRLLVWVEPSAVREICRHLFRDLGARYVISVGADDRPYSGSFVVAHTFAWDADHLLVCVLVSLSADRPRLDSISPLVPAANWAEREFRDLVGIEPVGHPYPKRLILPDGWPEGLHPLRKDVAHDFVPEGYNPDAEFAFDAVPEGCVAIPFGPFHPTLDEPAHFRLYVEGEMVRGCEYRGFMVHRGIEKLAETVLGYNDIPVMAERICGICGCVHSVAYVQAVEAAAGIAVPARAEYIRTILLEIERLHSHLLWVGLAGHLVGFDTLFMHAFRVREPVMELAERLTGNRKTYGLCVVGGVRWDLDDEARADCRRVLDSLEKAWRGLTSPLLRDGNLQARTREVGVADADAVREYGMVGPVARAAGVSIDVRRDHPYAAYDRVSFEVITADGGDVWSRVVVRALEVFESVKIIRQCLDKMEPGPLVSVIDDSLPAGRLGLSSVEAPRGESHHFLVTGEGNRPRRWRVRAPTYQNLQGIPGMIRDRSLADMTIALGSIDPCFSCTDRLETVEVGTGRMRTWSAEEVAALGRRRS